MSVTLSFSHLYPKTFLKNLLPAQNPGCHNFLMSLCECVYKMCASISSLELEDTIITVPSKPAVYISKILDPLNAE